MSWNTRNGPQKGRKGACSNKTLAR